MTSARRLLGTWKSDRRYTLSEIRPRLRKRSRKLRLFASIFGHLTLKFTRGRLYSQFKGDLDVTRYRVLAQDRDSVAILIRDGFLGKPRIQHIHFDGPRYWVSIGPYREWFKRVRPRRS